MKRLISLLAITTVCLTTGADPISREQAISIARQFLGSGAASTYTMQSPRKVQGRQQAPPAYYIVNRGKADGFVIVAGDDRLPAILGYSSTGEIDPARMPDGLRELLDLYSDEIGHFSTLGLNLSEKPNTDKIGQIGPLLGTTAWDQDYPYNLLTPCYAGSQHSATGCAATAMAQIMYSHRYPAQGQGHHAYQSSHHRLSLEVDFSESHYQWDQMQPVYGEWDTQESRDAVALLMRDCGYAIDMDYGATSGAEPDAWPVPLMTYFGYDRGLTNRRRENYSLDEWNHIIHTELQAGRPVFAGGFASNGGHAFVIDGIDGMGLFHVNWGWSGVSNGYFRTSALTPAIQGTGGADGGFNSRQTIITGIQPAQTDSELTPEFLSAEAVKATVTSDLELTLRLGGKVTNAGWGDATVDFGFGIYDRDWQLLLAIASADEACTIEKDKFRIGISSTQAELSSLSDGEYTIYPTVREHGGKHWHRVHMANQSKPNHLTLTIANRQATVATPTRPQLEATEVQPMTAIYQNVKTSVSVTLRNKGDMPYSDPICMALFNPANGAKIAEGDSYLTDIYAQDSVKLQMVSTFNVTPGTYHLAFIDENGQKLHQPITVEVLTTPTIATNAEPSAPLCCEQASAEELRFTASLHAHDGVFAGNIVVYVYDEFETTTTPLGATEPQFVFIEDDETVNVTFSGSMENAQTGMTYKATLVNLDENTYIRPRQQASCLFTISETGTGLMPIISQPSADSQRYDLQGRPARPGQHGILIKDGHKTMY